MHESNSSQDGIKPISRRALLKLAGLATGGLFLAACGAADPGTDETPTVEATPEAAPAPVDDVTPEAAPGTDEPRYGGRLRWGSDRSPDGFLDPGLATGIAGTFATWIYDNLVSIDEEYANLIPRLATNWYIENDAQTWVFELRQGVRFQHGREFVADDVLHTIGRILDPNFGSPAMPTLSNIAEVEALDDHTVRFHLHTANADFPVTLTGWQHGIVPYDLTDEQINSEPRGTGPFAIDRWRVADRILFHRNEDYWEEGRPYLDELEVVVIPEATTLVNSLQAGELDAIRIVPASLLPIVEGNPNLSVRIGAPGRKEHIFMRLDVEPFTEERVRRAFKLIPDREVMTELVWGGLLPAQLADDNPVMPTSPVHIETEIWQQDLAEARRLLEEAGYGDGLEIDLWAINDIYGVTEFSLAFADWAAEAGVTVNIVGVPGDRYYAENWLEVSLGTVGWSPRTTADEMLRIAYHSDAAWNETRYRNPEFDAMLDEALAEPDEERRAGLYAEIQRKIITEGGQIIHCHTPEVAGVRDNVHDYRHHPHLDFTPRDVWLSD